MKTRRSSANEEELHNHSCWVPGTPVRPIAPKPQPGSICDFNRQEDELPQTNWLLRETFPFMSAPEVQAYLESGIGITNWEALSAAAAPAARSGNISFTQHLAMAECSPKIHTSGMDSSFMPTSVDDSEQALLAAEGLLLASQEPSLRSDVQFQSNCNQGMPLHYETSTSGRPWYDLNSLPGTLSDPITSEMVPPIAPVTPDKYRTGGNKDSETNIFFPTGQANEGKNKERGVYVTAVDVNGCDKELLQQAEDYNPDDGINVIDLNKTPQQQKQRRKKHRPKVVIEGKPKRTPKAMAPKPTVSKSTSTVKRKYVRKNPQNKTSTTPPAEVSETVADQKTVEPSRRSCRRALQFDSYDQAQNSCAEVTAEKSAAGIVQRTETMFETAGVSGAYDLNLSVNKIVKDYTQLLGSRGLMKLEQTDSPEGQLRVETHSRSYMVGQGQESKKQGSMKHSTISSSYQNAARSPIGSNSSTSGSPPEEVQTRGVKRTYSETTHQPQLGPPNVTGTCYDSMQTYQPYLHADDSDKFFVMHFPEIYKKKRTEKVTSSSSSGMQFSVTSKIGMGQVNDCKTNPHASKDNFWIPSPQWSTSRLQPILGDNSNDRVPILQSMAIPSLLSGLTKKRTRGHTRVRDIASLNEIICFKEPNYPANKSPTTYGGHYTCIDALVAETKAMLSTKKRSKKRNTGVKSASDITNSSLKGLNRGYKHQQFLDKSEGSLEVLQKRMLSIDSLAEQLKRLNINSRIAYQNQHALVPYNMMNQDQNALVLYRRDGTVVPFEGSFDPVRKRRPRPKVDLDEETTRVWQLLMADINSEGVDGKDADKVKWWEEERRVFQGRAASFIARMRLVQGDRRFSRWKGSVVDSVVGVFLTQNVSDHLSSSAFMSLAARFPIKSKSKFRPVGETNIIIKDPEICILDQEDTMVEKAEMAKHHVCDLSSSEFSEEKVVVNSSEFFGSCSSVIPFDDSKAQALNFCERGVEMNTASTQCTSSYQVKNAMINVAKEGRPTDDEILSQNSVVSSQNSTDSSVSLMGERIGSCSESNSEVEELTTRSNDSNSLLDLLQMTADTPSSEFYGQGNSNLSSTDKPRDANLLSECLQYDQGRDILDTFDDSRNFMEFSSNLPNKPATDYRTLETGASEDKNSCHFSNGEHEKNMSEESGITEESTSQITLQKEMVVVAQEATRLFSENDQSCRNSGCQGSHAQFSTGNNHYGKMRDVLTNSAVTSSQSESTWKADHEKDIRELTVDSSTKEQRISSDTLTKSNTSSIKKVKVRKAEEKTYNWDNLRKQAQINGRTREQTPNTMDSLDWEAVRSADVDDIAFSIKERGMNNMLAERIKAFLNRLVEEHGSIDLEWLRDVPPDKAKEYLLSFRGLGLKSVECVRLLTLHHLAFPVDTNVGRIAVRLGWVPLQPLPESLQLHLLELYPVLESIQKFLWPRLCKLDQLTLYELHYHMITFGKVFCTKSKPNCNACPMRGECRHFASAFASARLALPGPEEKSLVSTNKSIPAGQDSASVTNSADIMNSLPLPLPPPSQEAELRPETSICKPIIEEPASPEPECTQEETDIEDTFFEDPNEIPTIKLNIEEFTQNLQNFMEKNMELQEGDLSKALVALTPSAASIPMPKLKNVNRLRTEHQVYELPDSHPLLEGMDKREFDDPCSYLLAIWTPGETATSIQPPEQRCNSQEYGQLCSQETCFSCNSIREANSQTVRGTLLIPCRTAMRGSFPLNGTYFQVNEVFADHDSSLNPIDIPRSMIWNLPRRTVYFGTSIPTIFRGLSTEGIQHCFWRGYVCVRGFDQKTRAPRPLMARLHFPASKLTKRKDQKKDE